ncbi:alpha-1,2-fucosyltransferase [Bacteroides sp.]
MIVSSLYGGLGNQMFIYAMVKAMSLRNKVPFAFNLKSDFANDYIYKRELALSDFSLKLPESCLLTFDYLGGGYIRSFSRKLGRNVIVPSYRFICETRPCRFEEYLVREENKKVYLEGYWQSDRYFIDYEKEIRQDFVISKNFSEDVYCELKEINSVGENAVMIGVRRYQESTVAPGGVLDADYYKKAMDLIASKISSPVFFCFSQDPEWVLKNLSGKYPIRMIKIKEGNNRAIDDLFLMINCKHYIISNSSFYWWGAWLSKNQDKIVVAPNNFVNIDSLPKDWLKLY